MPDKQQPEFFVVAGDTVKSWLTGLGLEMRNCYRVTIHDKDGGGGSIVHAYILERPVKFLSDGEPDRYIRAIDVKALPAFVDKKRYGAPMANYRDDISELKIVG